jgi:hypothetical protein
MIVCFVSSGRDKLLHHALIPWFLGELIRQGKLIRCAATSAFSVALLQLTVLPNDLNGRAAAIAGNERRKTQCHPCRISFS